jgi:hypothetical protein
LQTAYFAGFLFPLAQGLLLSHRKALVMLVVLMNIHGVPFSRPTDLDDATRPGVAPLIMLILP